MRCDSSPDPCPAHVANCHFNDERREFDGAEAVHDEHEPV